MLFLIILNNFPLSHHFRKTESKTKKKHDQVSVNSWKGVVKRKRNYPKAIGKKTTRDVPITSTPTTTPSWKESKQQKVWIQKVSVKSWKECAEQQSKF